MVSMEEGTYRAEQIDRTVYKNATVLCFRMGQKIQDAFSLTLFANFIGNIFLTCMLGYQILIVSTLTTARTKCTCATAKYLEPNFRKFFNAAFRAIEAMEFLLFFTRMMILN